MKKNTIIIVLAMTTVLSIIYAFIKADESHKARMEAEIQHDEADKLRDKAVSLEEAAVKAATEARMAEAEALEMKAALEDCQSR